ncbi:MAG: hypothetical protein RIB98_19045 [Acidimicrobiales bacterium]
MDLRWQEEQRAFQARILIDADPELGLRPYRTFVGAPTRPPPDRHLGRWERLIIVVVAGAVIVALALVLGLPRELAALTASAAGGIALMVALAPVSHAKPTSEWTPLLAVYAPSVLRGAPPVCVTQISFNEYQRLGTEGFGTVVGNPRPGATFGLFVDEYLVWPRTPPRPPQDDDPGFGSS